MRIIITLKMASTILGVKFPGVNRLSLVPTDLSVDGAVHTGLFKPCGHGESEWSVVAM